MKLWIQLLCLAAVAAATDHACDIDDPDLPTGRAYTVAMSKFEPCFKNAVSAQVLSEAKHAESLGDVRKFTTAFCEHSSRAVSCLAEVRASFEHCHNKDLATTAMILGDLVEHLLPGACENDGERLAYLAHGGMLVAKKKNTLIPLRQCVTKVSALLKAGADSDLDVVSETYIVHKELPRFKKCLKHVEDDTYKAVVEWLLNEAESTLMCRHPEEDRLVRCAEVDVSKVPISNICDTKVLHHTNLYDYLENATKLCFSPFISHDLDPNFQTTDLDDLKDTYRMICSTQKKMPTCLLQNTAYAEACLSQEEDKQFQLFAQSMEDFAERSCVEEGAKMAAVMHEVYRQTPEHGHALRDCYKTGEEARKSHQGHAVSSKNMRYYHETIAFKQCLVEKLHSNNLVSQGMENMMNDVLKKMKCVNPEDGTVVLCETIHEHNH